jgi:ATP synthase protein I
VGFDWASRATTIGLEFALPPLLGSVGDRWWRTAPWLTVVGAVLGFAVGMMHVLRIAQSRSVAIKDPSSRPARRDRDE